MKNRIIFCLPFLLLSCKQTTSHETTEGNFAIYTLKDSSLTSYDTMNMALENIILSEAPFITTNDVIQYNWKAHTLEFTTEMEGRFDHFRRYGGSTQGVPFVVAVGPERIYLGTFWWAYSSSMPPACAVIGVISQPPYKIALANNAPEKRNDARIYNSLKKAGVLIE